MVAKPPAAEAQVAQERPTTPLPSARQIAAETSPPQPRADVYTTDWPGSDFMVDVIKSLGFEYCRRQSRLQLPRPARIHHQLRRQQVPRAAHLLPRGILGRHGARLRQDRRQADDGHGARHRRPAARLHGDLQRLRRPRARLHRARQHPRHELPPRRRRMGPQRAGRRRHGSRLHASGTTPRSRSRTSPNPPCAPTKSR